MKLKRLSEDFQVEELSDFAMADGPYALYRLTKRAIGTLEAIEAVSRRWNVPRHRISYGGLKDRYAMTRQFVTIAGGPRRPLAEDRFELAYLGQATRPFAPRDIAGNRFTVVMRDLGPAELARAIAATAHVARDGIPNYFDDQRFGSLGESGEFIARAWCEQRWERALWLAIAEANEHDRPDDRKRKAALRDRWGDWKAAKAQLDRSHARSIVSFLADRPGDFKGAFGRLNKDLRSLWLAAFQSHLWNRMLSSLLRDVCTPRQLVTLGRKAGTLLFPGPLDDAQREQLATTLPLPSARAKLAEGTARSRAERVLADEGLTLEALKIRHPKDSYFSRGERAALVTPSGLAHEEGADDLYPGRRRLTLRFDLPRGSYATILVKRLTEAEAR